MTDRRAGPGGLTEVQRSDKVLTSQIFLLTQIRKLNDYRVSKYFGDLVTKWIDDIIRYSLILQLIACFLSHLSNIVFQLYLFISRVWRFTDIITDLPLHCSLQHHAAASAALLSLQWDHVYGYKSHCIRYFGERFSSRRKRVPSLS